MRIKKDVSQALHSESEAVGESNHLLRVFGGQHALGEIQVSVRLGRAIKPLWRVEVIGCFEGVWLEFQRAQWKSLRGESGIETDPGIWRDLGD